MNRTKIEWTDFTWNPVTGCWGPGGTAEKPNRCLYCYAEKNAHRFNRLKYTAPFTPWFYPLRLYDPVKVKKPSKIFVCSMADLFGDWVPSDWIEDVLLYGPLRCPLHTFQFLTKNPKRLKDFNPWPNNCWVGTTVTNQADANERLPWLLQVDASVRFVSHEPLLAMIDVRRFLVGAMAVKVFKDHGGKDATIIPEHLKPSPYLHWAILGAQTGPGAVKPDAAMVAALVNQYHDAGVPVFMKNNLKPPMGRLVQEWPRP